MNLDFGLSMIVSLFCISSVSSKVDDVTIANWECESEATVVEIHDELLNMNCEYDQFETVKNGRIDCCNKEKPNICLIRCLDDKKYTLIGRQFNECHPNKKWRFPFPECLKKQDCHADAINRDKRTVTKCTAKGCFTRCNHGYTLSGEYKLSCDSLKNNNKNYMWPKCIPKYMHTYCTEEQHRNCLNKSKTTCSKESEVALCIPLHGDGLPSCHCGQIDVKGDCNAYDKLQCLATERNCYPGEEGHKGYSEAITCRKKKPNGFQCSCKITKKLPCPELARNDPDRTCGFYDNKFNCVFTCAPGERTHDPWGQQGHRFCSLNGKWNYPIYIECLKE